MAPHSLHRIGVLSGWCMLLGLIGSSSAQSPDAANSIYANTTPPKTPLQVAAADDAATGRAERQGPSTLPAGKSPPPSLVGPQAISGTSQGQTTPQTAGQVTTAADTAAASPGSLEDQPLGHRRPAGESGASDDRPVGALPSLARTMGSLLIVLAVMGAVALVLRRTVFASGRAAAAGGIEILARNAINPKQSLCLIQLGQRLVLLGLSPNHMASLQTIEDPEDVAQILGGLEQQKVHSISNTFGKLFQKEKGFFVAGEHSDENAVNDLDLTDTEDQNSTTQQWYQAKGELTSLFDKVKGLARIRFRS
ncbi:MAG: flagellar biosynthetic protein FliO [Sedimentisphaerales bacterium]|nr:flagellar biosynthetic protein FliO [Sedimentisphaerales bacterium]